MAHEDAPKPEDADAPAGSPGDEDGGTVSTPLSRDVGDARHGGDAPEWRDDPEAPGMSVGDRESDEAIEPNEPA